MEWQPLTTLVVAMTSVFSLTSIVYWSLKLGIAPTPTSARVRKTLIDALPDSVDGLITEAGCGFGTLISALKKKYPDKLIVGLEMSLLPFYFCRLRFCCDRNVKIRRINLFDFDFSESTCIVCYLYPAAMEKLSDKFREELNDDTLIITHTFRLQRWTPEVHSVSTDIYKTPVYLYKAS